MKTGCWTDDGALAHVEFWEQDTFSVHTAHGLECFTDARCKVEQEG
jgi:hypothetical protein